MFVKKGGRDTYLAMFVNITSLASVTTVLVKVTNTVLVNP